MHAPTRTRLIAAATAAAIAVLTTVGCASAKAPRDPAPTPPGQTQTQGQTSTVAQPTPPKTGTLVTYTRTGGIAGVNDSVVVDVHGNVAVRSRLRGARRSHMSATALRALRRALVAAHFEQPVTVGPGVCSDCFEFRLTYAGYTVNLVEINEPTRFDPLLRILTGLADGRKP